METIYTSYKDYKWWEELLGSRAEERRVETEVGYFKYLTLHTPDGEVFTITGPEKEMLSD